MAKISFDMEENHAHFCFFRTAQWDLFDLLHLEKKFIATTTHGSIRPSAPRMLSTPSAEPSSTRAEPSGPLQVIALLLCRPRSLRLLVHAIVLVGPDFRSL